jgi:ketosteroid isomerase-like protein
VSQENEAIVLAICTAWERGDFSSSEWADPAIEFVMADGPAPGQWEGLAAMADGVREWLNAWADFRFEVVEHRELDSERVLVFFQFSARGRASGLEVGQIWTEAGGLFHLRSGRVTRLVQYLDRQHALEAVGLSE